MAKRIQPSDAKLEITQVKSYVGQKQNMRDTLRFPRSEAPGQQGSAHCRPRHRWHG